MSQRCNAAKIFFGIAALGVHRSLTDDNSMMDSTNLILIGLAAALIVWYWLGSRDDGPENQEKAHQETRKAARALIALPADSARADLFELQPMPLRIVPTQTMVQEFALPPADTSDPVLRDALWLRQRELIVRLESELEMAQQAEVSDHFAVAGPANQPGQMLDKTLGDLEKAFRFFAERFEAPVPHQLWVGRALVLLLSNRKLFDHVAWLTGAGSVASRTGSYFLANDGIVLIPLYATRLGGYGRTLLRQVVRVFLYHLDAKPYSFPRWLEEMLALWAQPHCPGLVDQAPAPLRQQQQQGNKPAEVDEVAFSAADVFNDDKWDQAFDEPLLMEKMTAEAVRLGKTVMQTHSAQLVKVLHETKAGGDFAALWSQHLPDTPLS